MTRLAAVTFALTCLLCLSSAQSDGELSDSAYSVGRGYSREYALRTCVRVQPASRCRRRVGPLGAQGLRQQLWTQQDGELGPRG